MTDGDIGEFYGRNPREANLDLLSRFFEKHPELADKAFLSVKVSAGMEELPCEISSLVRVALTSLLLNPTAGRSKLTRNGAQ